MINTANIIKGNKVQYVIVKKQVTESSKLSIVRFATAKRKLYVKTLYQGQNSEEYFITQTSVLCITKL